MRAILFISLAFVASLSCCAEEVSKLRIGTNNELGRNAGAENVTRLRETLESLDSCMQQSLYSFLYSSSYPPTTIDGLRRACKTQAEGLKCVRDRSKNTPAILKRGLLAFVQTRQRYHKKYCSNVNSELSKQFVNDLKCIMEKKAALYKSIDIEFLNSMLEIQRRNYSDSAPELKYLCCTLLYYRRAIIDSVGPECSSSKAQVEEMIMSIVSNDISLICEDEEKLLTKVCPKLEPMNVPKTIDGSSPAVYRVVLYLVATLGEPEEAS